MPTQEEVEAAGREYLGKLSAARYEAGTFMARHPEFFSTPENGKMITDYIDAKNLAPTVENLEHAFEKLKSRGLLLPAREVVAKMSADEVKKFGEMHGMPVYDGHGRLAGYDLPDAYNEPRPDFNRPRLGASFTQSRPPLHPEDARRDPSKREFAMWDADRQRDWLIARDFWGKDLPKFLK